MTTTLSVGTTLKVLKRLRMIMLHFVRFNATLSNEIGLRSYKLQKKVYGSYTKSKIVNSVILE